MQFIDQSIALVFIDDKGEIQIVGSLADQIDTLFSKQLERLPQLMQDRANIASHQAHRGARADNLNAAQ